MEVLLITLSIITYGIVINAVPPPACMANFRWDDCGKAPEPVMYYWKPGSRCEVGIWRGCLPNINMFRDEFECVSTCIFAVRAHPPDWHKIKLDYEDTTPVIPEIDDQEGTTSMGEQDSQPAQEPGEGTTSIAGEEAPPEESESETPAVEPEPTAAPE